MGFFDDFSDLTGWTTAIAGSGSNSATDSEYVSSCTAESDAAWAYKAFTLADTDIIGLVRRTAHNVTFNANQYEDWTEASLPATMTSLSGSWGLDTTNDHVEDSNTTNFTNGRLVGATDHGTIDHYVIVQVVDYDGQTPGVILRHGDPASGDSAHYQVLFDSNNETTVGINVDRHGADGSFGNGEVRNAGSILLTKGNWYAFAISGTGTSTKFYAANLGSTEPGSIGEIGSWDVIATYGDGTTPSGTTVDTGNYAGLRNYTFNSQATPMTYGAYRAGPTVKDFYRAGYFPAISIQDEGTPGSAGTHATVDATIWAECGVAAGGTYLRNDTDEWWDEGRGAWIGAPAAAETSANVGTGADWRKLGIQIDTTAGTYKLFSIGRAGNASDDDVGHRMTALTTAHSYASMTNPQLVIGSRFNDVMAVDGHLESVLLDDETPIEGVANVGGTSQTSPGVYHEEAFRGVTAILPIARDSDLVSLGASGAFDDENMRWATAREFSDGERIYYEGADTDIFGTYSLGVTTPAAWEDDDQSGSQIISTTDIGDGCTGVSRADIWEEGASDYRMIVAAEHSGNFRLYYFTASSSDGPWTKQTGDGTNGSIAEETGTGTNANGYSDPHVVKVGSDYKIVMSAHGANGWSLYTGDIDADFLNISNITEWLPVADTAVDTFTGISGNSVTGLSDSSFLSKNDYVFLREGNEIYPNQVRKVVSASEVELFFRPAFGAVSTGDIVRADAGSITPSGVHQRDDGDLDIRLTMFQPFNNATTGDSANNLESAGVATAPDLSTTPTIQHHRCGFPALKTFGPAGENAGLYNVENFGSKAPALNVSFGSGGTTIEASLTLASNYALSSSAVASRNATTTLAHSQQVTTAGTGTFEASLTLGHAQQADTSASAQLEASTSLAHSQQASTTGTLSVEGAVTFDMSLMATTAALATLEASATLAHSQTMDAQVIAALEAVATLAHNEALDTTAQQEGLAEASISLDMSHALTVTAQAVLEAALTLAQQATLTTVGGKAISGALALAMTQTQATTADISIEGTVSFDISADATMQVQADLEANTALGLTGALSVIADAVLEAGLTFDAVNSITIAGSTVVAGLTAPDGRTFIVSARVRSFSVPGRSRTFTVN